MSAELRRDMTIDEVRKVLRGWRESLPSATLSTDKTHLYYSIELTPPDSINRRPIRLTFDNGRLLIWGEPAEDSGTAARAG